MQFFLYFLLFFLVVFADPCVDFYEYVCGRWIANSTIPPYQPAWAKQWDGVTKYVEKLTIGLLEKDKGPAGIYFYYIFLLHNKMFT